MPRPKRLRWISFAPDVTYYKPRGIPLRMLKEVSLGVDELEALRLVDLEGLGQVEAAERMNISQSTFQRILTTAHQKVSEALIRGKAIRIEGGDYKMTKQPTRQFKCEDCGNIWEVPFGTGQRGIEMKCPKCSSGMVHRIDSSGHGFGRQPWGYNWPQLNKGAKRPKDKSKIGYFY